MNVINLSLLMFYLAPIISDWYNKDTLSLRNENSEDLLP